VNGSEPYLDTAEPRPAETAAFARLYMRHRIATAPVLTAGQRDRLGAGGWLGPEMFHALTAGPPPDPARLDALIDRNPGLSSRIQTLTTRSTAAAGPGWPAAPSLREGSATLALPWLASVLASLNAEVRRMPGRSALWLSSPTEAAAAVERIEEALRRLAAAWPEAAAETRILTSGIVYLSGGGFRSATPRRFPGAMLIGVGCVTSVEAACEMLLHETGHAVLYLKSAADRYVENGAEPVHHPLRTELRPVYGALHAAFAMYRVAHGLRALGECGHSSPEQEARRAENRSNLDATLRTLRQHARWTPRGRRLSASLHAEPVIRPERAPTAV
jgi:HEXXH motif-containing protein